MSAKCEGSELLKDRVIPDMMDSGDKPEAFCKLPARLSLLGSEEIEDVYSFTSAELDTAWRPVYYEVEGSSTSTTTDDCVSSTDTGGKAFTYVGWLPRVTTEAAGRSWIHVTDLDCTEDGDYTGDGEATGSIVVNRPAVPRTSYSSPMPVPVSPSIAIPVPNSGGGGGGGSDYAGYFKIVVTSTKVRVIDAATSNSAIAGVVRLGDGSTQNVSVFEMNIPSERVYFYVVMDVQHTPIFYVLSTTDSSVTSLVGGVLYIGYYDPVLPSSTRISQSLRTGVPVNIGPSYIGPYCTLPGPPAIGTAGIHTRIVNPLGGLTLGSYRFRINGYFSSAYPLVDPSVITGSFTIYAKFTPPVYAETGAIWEEPPSLVFGAYEGFNGTYYSQTSMLNYSLGVFDAPWTVSLRASISTLLMQNPTEDW